MCVLWAFQGECTKNQGYMVFNCQNSCQVCSGSFTGIYVNIIWNYNHKFRQVYYVLVYELCHLCCEELSQMFIGNHTTSSFYISEFYLKQKVPFKRKNKQ